MIHNHSMVAPLRRVVLKRPAEAFRSDDAIQREWASLNYIRPPDLNLASMHHQAFVSLVTEAGAEPLYLPADERTGLDSLYVHDPVLMTNRGAIILQTGKVARRGEGPAFAGVCGRWDIPVFGIIDGNATAEAGDTLWLDNHTLLAGRSFRTNTEGIQALEDLLSQLDVKVIAFDLPYWHGVNEVLHLQSFISLLDDDLAVVYRPLLPVAMFDLLAKRGIQMIDVHETEFNSLGCNVLAIAPRRIVMVAGNPLTGARMEAVGCRVSEFDGSEICIPGSGGPTCLTRPVLRG